VPRSATAHIERLWYSLKNATDAAMVTSGMEPEFKYYAMMHFNFVYNRSPTEANKLGDGEAPFKTIGADIGLERLVPFGNPCVVHVPPTEKGVLANERGRIIGYGSDTPGYIVALDRDPSKPDEPRRVITSVDVTPRRAGEVWDTDTTWALAKQDSAAVLLERTGDYEQLPTTAEALAADAGTVATNRAPVVQSVGTAPGDAGSRASLLPRGQRQRATAASPACLSKDAAAERITAAAVAGQAFVFEQVNPKHGVCRDRYEVYKSATTFDELEALSRRRLANGRHVLKGGRLARSGDFMNDVRHHFVRFHDAAPQAAEEEACTVGAAELSAAQPVATPPTPAHAAGDLGVGVDLCGQAVQSPWKGRLRRRVRAGVAVSAVPPSSALGGDDEAPLSVAEAALLAEVRAWRGPNAATSKRRSVGVGADVPHRLVRAAVADTTGESSLEDVLGDGMVKVFDIKGPDAALVPRSLPRGFSGLRKEPDWTTGILPGIRTELVGLVEAKVYTVVPWEPWMHGDLIRTHRLDSVTAEKHKSRLVAEGNRTKGDGIHFDQVATSMAAQTSVKITVSFAAGCGYGLYAIDFKQAFLQADVANPDLYIELPDLPFELEGAGCGPGKGKGMVGRLNKALYGLRDSPRLWAIHLRKFLTSDVVGVQLLTSDRNVFKWSFQGETLMGCIHVDDVLLAPSGDAIRLEFLRRVKSCYNITGGDGLVKKFCGYEFRYDATAQTITMHQESFVRAVLDKYETVGVKPMDTPMLVGATPLEPWTGVATDRQAFDYAMFIGDLTWMTRTNPRLAFVAQDLSRFVTNPGPDHVIAARRVLAHLKSDPGRGLTFHGSSTVLNQSYPHRHLLTGMTDSGFSHKGQKAVSGVTVLMNGAAILHVSRRQATVSNSSTEAEVKAAALLAEVLASVVPLWSELAGARHPAVRCMIDNKGAKKMVESGTDTVASAPFLRSKAYTECKIYSGLMWMDLVPGGENPADVTTKQVRDTQEFRDKDGIISGLRPFLFESDEVRRLLAKRQA